jgi:hypothetical protein
MVFAMEARATEHCLGSFGSLEHPILEVVIVYEDLGTALRAKRSLEFLPRQVRAEGGMKTKLWKLDMLKVTFLREQAALEAAAADLIILSVHGASELPGEAQDWLRRWVDHQPGPSCAVGLLLDPEVAGQGSHNPVTACVQRFAEAAGAELVGLKS